MERACRFGETFRQSPRRGAVHPPRSSMASGGATSTMPGAEVAIQQMDRAEAGVLPSTYVGLQWARELNRSPMSQQSMIPGASGPRKRLGPFRAPAQKVSIRGDGSNRAHHQNRRWLGAHRPLPGGPRDLDSTDEALLEPEKLGNEACQASRYEESEGCACTQACRHLAPDVDRWNRLHGQKARQGGCSGRCLIGGIKTLSGGVITPATPEAKSRRWDDGSSQAAHNVVAFLRRRASRLVGPVPFRPHQVAALRRPRTEA
jgi:hypothetical protein